MATEDQPKQARQRLVTRNDWIGCSLVAILLTLANAKNQPNAGIAGLLGAFIGSLVVVVLIWVMGRGIVRWFTKKRA
jgi:Kef-type K+ transport system membrane component KefB